MEARAVVIIEDDVDIREVLATVFGQGGFRVHTFASGAEGVKGVREYCPLVVILDVGLPDIDGYEVARQLRLFSNTYVLMLTARSQETDVLLGLEAGADDYVSKPFRPREVRYRVEALLRRPRIRSDTVSLTDSPLEPETVATRGTAEAAGPATVTAHRSMQLYQHNGLRLNLRTRTAEVDGAEVRLTGSEFELLHTLLRTGRTVHAKEDLALVLGRGNVGQNGFGRESDEQVVQVHIANLRKKLGDSPADPRWVETVHGFGYRLAASRDSPVAAEA
ncbi:response regulator transcription factor [Pseudarthrobacter sp. NamB4]|uniref:response regulator transcription factor n=1 Tax=Pseudarthrobacter sp. NamB4 TaxID=2576837 RepID=UPI0026929512